MIFSRSKNPASTDGPRKRPDSQSPSTTVTTSLSPSHHHGDPEVVSSSTPPQKERNDDKILPDDTKTASVSSDTKSMPTDVLQSPSSSRRRAAVTQGTVPGGTCSAPAVLTLSSYIPNATSAPGIPNRHSESASIGSSSFCSLVDQVDVLSTADQYFTPEPPSSPSSVSAVVKTTGSPTPTNDR